MTHELKPLGRGPLSEDEMARVLAEDEEANSHGDEEELDDEECETLVARIQNAMLTDDDDQSERLATLYANADAAGRQLLDDALVCICGYTIPTLLSMGPNDDVHLAEHGSLAPRPVETYRATALDRFWQVIDRNERYAVLAANTIAWHAGDMLAAHRYAACDLAHTSTDAAPLAGFLYGMLQTYDRRAFKAEWEQRNRG